MQTICAMGIVLFFVIIAVYLPAMSNGFVNWDDDKYIYENANIHVLNPSSLYWMLTAFHSYNWHPLTWLSHAVDCFLAGLNPRWHHLMSIVLHALNTLLVFVLATTLAMRYKSGVRGPDKRSRTTGALITGFVTAVLFGVHPIHVESVVWLSERKDLLCAFFGLLSILTYLFYTFSAGRRERRRWLTGSLFLYGCSLFSKPMSVSLPLVLLLLDIYPLNRFREHSKIKISILVEKVPFIILAIASSAITIVAQYSGGAVGSFEHYPLYARLINGLGSILFYVSKLCWPVTLVPFYPFPMDSRLLTMEYIIPGIGAVCITLIAYRALRKGSPLFFSAWYSYVIMLLPILGIIQVGMQAAADRYMYMPSISVFLLCGLGLSWLFDKITMSSHKTFLSSLVCISTVGIVTVLGLLTTKQIRVWRNSYTLWTSVVNVFPDQVPFAYYNRGLYYYGLKRFDQAIADYEKALAAEPEFAKAHYNLGVTYYTLGMHDKARIEYEKALEANPDLSEAHNNLGLLYGNKGLYDNALAEYDKAIAIDPRNVEAHYNLGQLYFIKGMTDDAMSEYEKALAVNPRFIKAHNSLGLLYARKGMYDKAVTEYKKMLAIDPYFAEAHYNLGLAYFASTRIEDAIAAYEKALSLKPDFAEAHYNLGLAFYGRSDNRMAKIHFEKAVALGYKVDPKVLELIRQSHQ